MPEQIGVTYSPVRGISGRWRAALAAAMAASALAIGTARTQERAPDPDLLNQLGIMTMTSGLDPQHNKIDAILGRFGFSCLTEGPLGSPCWRTEARLADLLREFPADLDDIARELGALGATCGKQESRLECWYERRVVSTGWAAGYSGPLGRGEDLFRVEFTVTANGPSLDYGAKLSRFAQ